MVATRAAIVMGAGSLADRLGLRPVYLWSAAGYLASMVCIVFSPDLATMVGFRFLQATATGALFAVSPAIAARVFPPHRRGLGMGFHRRQPGVGDAGRNFGRRPAGGLAGLGGGVLGAGAFRGGGPAAGLALSGTPDAGTPDAGREFAGTHADGTPDAARRRFPLRPARGGGAAGGAAQPGYRAATGADAGLDFPDGVGAAAAGAGAAAGLLAAGTRRRLAGAAPGTAAGARFQRIRPDDVPGPLRYFRHLLHLPLLHRRPPGTGAGDNRGDAGGHFLRPFGLFGRRRLAHRPHRRPSGGAGRAAAGGGGNGIYGLFCSPPARWPR